MMETPAGRENKYTNHAGRVPKKSRAVERTRQSYYYCRFTNPKRILGTFIARVVNEPKLRTQNSASAPSTQHELHLQWSSTDDFFDINLGLLVSLDEIQK